MNFDTTSCLGYGTLLLVEYGRMIWTYAHGAAWFLFTVPQSTVYRRRHNRYKEESARTMGGFAMWRSLSRNNGFTISFVERQNITHTLLTTAITRTRTPSRPTFCNNDEKETCLSNSNQRTRYSATRQARQQVGKGEAKLDGQSLFSIVPVNVEPFNPSNGRFLLKI